jgi:hypothetical protein
MSNVNPTKTPARASHEAIESTGGNATGVAETPEQRVDHAAMESAKRAQNRIHNNETENPGNSIFTK